MKNTGSPFRRRDLLKGAGSSTALLAPPNAQSQNRPKEAKVKIGVVGGGFGSAFQWHLDPDCSVAAVGDIRNDRLQRLSEVYRCPNTYKDFQNDAQTSRFECRCRIHAGAAELLRKGVHTGTELESSVHADCV